LWGHLDYLQKREIYLAKARRWDEGNKDRKRESQQAPEYQAKARARTVKWSSDNADRKRAYDVAYVQDNRARVREHKAMRRARERQATPPWLTMQMRAEIFQFYAEAERLSDETGIERQVDHIVPLAGKTVCGLHVPWNLRVIHGVANNRRPRVWSPDNADGLAIS
jgi:hypothetical protein